MLFKEEEEYIEENFKMSIEFFGIGIVLTEPDILDGVKMCERLLEIVTEGVYTKYLD